MCRDGTFYQDLGPGHFVSRAKGDRTVRLVRQLNALGYTVQSPAQKMVLCEGRSKGCLRAGSLAT